MGYSRGNDRGGGRDRGRGGFGGNRGGGRDRERPEMHKATCSDCGDNCEVPFKPTNDKPIYCSDCFRGHDNDSGGGRDRGRGGDRGGDRGGFGRSDREMHKAVCDECGKNCEVPFRPTNDKPIYCSECFGNKEQGGRDRGGRGGSNAPDNSKQLKEIVEKLVKILNVIAPTIQHKISLDDKKKKTSKTKSISNPKRENRKTVSKPKKVSKKKVEKEKAKKVAKKAVKKKPAAKKKTAPKKK